MGGTVNSARMAAVPGRSSPGIKMADDYTHVCREVPHGRDWRRLLYSFQSGTDGH